MSMPNNAMQYKLKPCEMETTIRWDRQERVAHIFTAMCGKTIFPMIFSMNLNYWERID